MSTTDPRWKTASRALVSGVDGGASNVADRAGVHVSTVYSWMSSGATPSIATVRTMLRSMSAAASRACVLDYLLGGTGLVAVQLVDCDADLDINGDGKVDASDALTASIAGLRQMAESLEKVHDASQDGEITRAELAVIEATIGEAMRRLAFAREILCAQERLRQRRRRQARPRRRAAS